MIFESDLPEGAENIFSVGTKDIPETFTGTLIRNALPFHYSNSERNVVSQLIAIPSIKIWDHQMTVHTNCTLHPTTMEAGLKMHFMLSETSIPATVQQEDDLLGGVSTDVALGAEEALLVNLPQGAHDAKFNKGNHSFFHLDFQTSLFLELIGNRKILNLWLATHKAEKEGRAQINTTPVKINSYCKLLIYQIRQHKYGIPISEIYLKKKCIQLIEYFAEEFASTDTPAPIKLTPDDVITLDNVKAAITLELHKNFNAQRLGRKFSIAPEILDRNFKQFFQRSIGDFSRDYKMEQAFKRFINKDFTTDTLAKSLGYKNVDAFTKAFHNYWGFSFA